MRLRLAHPAREQIHDIRYREIRNGYKAAHDGDRDEYNNCRLAKLRLGRPAGLPELRDRFTCEDANTAERIFHLIKRVAGQEGIEPPTNGFGDRYSTN